jgi:hypothetical protein
LFSLSLFAFVLAMMSFDIPALPARFSDRGEARWWSG